MLITIAENLQPRMRVNFNMDLNVRIGKSPRGNRVLRIFSASVAFTMDLEVQNSCCSNDVMNPPSIAISTVKSNIVFPSREEWERDEVNRNTEISIYTDESKLD